MIARVAGDVRFSRSAVGPLDEAALLERARTCSVGKLWVFCLKARHAADPEAVADEQRQLALARSLHIQTAENGIVSIEGWFDPAGGATLRTALEALAQPSGVLDDRQRPQRLADAAVELAHHAMDRGSLPEHGGQRPHLQVTATLEALLALPGAPAADLEFSHPVSFRTVERLACDATISRVLLNAESVVTDVGRARRVASPATRRALNVRDGHCRWPGCERPATWSAAHHLHHWVKGGETKLDNLILLCHRHHWMVHEGDWQLVPTEDGFRPIPPPLHYIPRRYPVPEVAAA